MGYASVMYVPRLFTYESAKRQFDRAKPIRGTTTRPLGRRRDHRMYSIRENDTGAIELVCYRTPVVTYKQCGTVRVKIDGWNSVSTRQFIQQTLGISTSAQKDYCILEVRGDKHTLKANEELLLTRDSTGWTVTNNHPRLSYRINRKGANSVRAMYKPFTNYLKSFVALRATDVRMAGVWGRPDYENKVIPLSLRELGEMFGVEDHAEDVYARGIRNGHPSATRTVKRTVTVPGVYALTERLAKDHKRKTEEMLELVKSGDAVKFYRAALWLCSGSMDLRLAYVESEADSIATFLDTNLPGKKFDEFVMHHHAQETVEVYPTPVGSVPSEKYKQWLA
jgi:hypothetical protein